MGQEEQTPLLSPTGQELRPSPLRWWMCGVLSAIAFAQGCVWNTWGPIAPAVQPYLGWSDGTIALLANWGPICYFVAVLPTAWLLDTRGLRLVCVAGAALVFGGSLLRCFTTSPTPCTVLAHFAQALNGLAGPVAMAAAPVLSATWFPVRERTTATAAMAMANNLGVALSFVLGPVLVPQSSDDDRLHKNILMYMWIQAGFTAVVLTCTLLAFPNKPPHAPTLSAGATRVDFVKGARQLLGMRQFWIVAASYGVMTGVQSGWSSYLAPNLENFLPQDEAEDTAGWLGFYGTLAGCLGGLLCGRCADVMGGRMKALLIGLGLGATLSALWFTLVCVGVAPQNSPSYYTSVIINGVCVAASMPIYYELAVESVYPIAEGVCTGMVTLMNNVGCLLFLILPYISALGSSWANWTLTGACAFGGLSMLFFRENYRRMSLDGHAAIRATHVQA